MDLFCNDIIDHYGDVWECSEFYQTHPEAYVKLKYSFMVNIYDYGYPVQLDFYIWFTHRIYDRYLLLGCYQV